jgi:hypothetical protein
MFVPFVFTLEVPSDYDYILPFHIYLDMAVKNGWPIISHERYFAAIENPAAAYIGSDWLDRYSKAYHFDVHKSVDERLQYKIPSDFEQGLVRPFPSQLDAWVNILKNDNVPFETLLDRMFDDITQKFGETIEGIICSISPKCLKNVAKKRNIPLLHFEHGLFRPPTYQLLTRILDFRGVYGDDELEERYYRFLDEIKTNPVPMLSRKEILRLLFHEKLLVDVDLIEKPPHYKMGVLESYYQYGVVYQHTHMTTPELRTRALRKYKPNEIAYRGHPAHSLESTAKYPTSFHFLCDCERVMGVMSTVLFEALLAGRAPYDYGPSAYAFMCGKDIEDDVKIIAPLEFINFYVFGYCIPQVWETNVDYLRFRLGKPSETAIYERMYDFLLNRQHEWKSSAQEALY